jgi:hypothetical protein
LSTGFSSQSARRTRSGPWPASYDACYHQACDTTNNLNTKALNELGDGVAHATWTLARSKAGLFEDQSLRARKAIKGKTDGPLAVR